MVPMRGHGVIPLWFCTFCFLFTSLRFALVALERNRSALGSEKKGTHTRALDAHKKETRHAARFRPWHLWHGWRANLQHLDNTRFRLHRGTRVVGRFSQTPQQHTPEETHAPSLKKENANFARMQGDPSVGISGTGGVPRDGDVGGVPAAVQDHGGPGHR